MSTTNKEREERKRLIASIRAKMKASGFPLDDYSDFHIVQAALAFRRFLAEQSKTSLEEAVA